jgi:hypothetical protein
MSLVPKDKWVHVCAPLFRGTYLMPIVAILEELQEEHILSFLWKGSRIYPYIIKCLDLQ